MKTPILALLTCAVLAACGGGGGGGSSVATTTAIRSPEGLWTGTLAGSASRNFHLLVLEDGEFWAPYGIDTGTAFFVAGFVQGHATASAGSFVSNDTRDFGFIPPLAETVSATYTDTTISGTVSSSAPPVTLSGSRPTATFYIYDTPADLQTIVGAWNLTSITRDLVALNIAANGTFTGSSAGCTFSGTFAPRPSGKNVFNVALTFGAAPCALPGASARGIAVSFVIGGQRELLVAGVDANRTAGTLLAGVR
jgi:hypothetical protein